MIAITILLVQQMEDEKEKATARLYQLPKRSHASSALWFQSSGVSGAAAADFAGKRSWRFSADQKLSEGGMYGRRLLPLCVQARP